MPNTTEETPMHPLTDTQLDEIAARHNAATPGPWGVYESGSMIDIAADLQETGCGYRARREICRLEDEPLDNDPTHREWTAEEDWAQVQADAEFIAHAPEDVAALLAEVRRLRARLAAYGTPVTSYPPLPKPDPAYAQIERRRDELETGFTEYEWAVGMVLCPARNKCTVRRLDSVFKPLKNGRLPMHRDQFGTPCAGAHKKPMTPPLQLRTAPVSA